MFLTNVSGFFISFFISLYYLKIFTEANLSWLIYESIKAFKIRTSIVFNLSSPNNTILLCFFFFFFITELHVLIPAIITQMFYSTEEIVIPTGSRTNEANTEIETHPVTVHARLSKCST